MIFFRVSLEISFPSLYCNRYAICIYLYAGKVAGIHFRYQDNVTQRNGHRVLPDLA